MYNCLRSVIQNTPAGHPSIRQKQINSLSLIAQFNWTLAKGGIHGEMIELTRRISIEPISFMEYPFPPSLLLTAAADTKVSISTKINTIIRQLEIHREAHLTSAELSF
jgi:hypothetical protein